MAWLLGLSSFKSTNHLISIQITCQTFSRLGNAVEKVRKCREKSEIWALMSRWNTVFFEYETSISTSDTPGLWCPTSPYNVPLQRSAIQRSNYMIFCPKNDSKVFRKYPSVYYKLHTTNRCELCLFPLSEFGCHWQRLPWVQTEKVYQHYEDIQTH